METLHVDRPVESAGRVPSPTLPSRLDIPQTLTLHQTGSPPVRHYGFDRPSEEGRSGMVFELHLGITLG